MPPLLPYRYRVKRRHVENAGSVTLQLRPVGERLSPFLPGQFAMLYAPGLGELPVPVSGATTDGSLVHTVHDDGTVGHALHGARVGSLVGVRGPYGTSWDVESAMGGDLVVIAEGSGLASLRPVVEAALARRASYRRLVLAAGAATPTELLFHDELARWSAAAGVDVLLTVDIPTAGWSKQVGPVAKLLGELSVDPARTRAFVCGSGPTMLHSATALTQLGVPSNRISVSLEQYLHCGVGFCGRCLVGPSLVCVDGPVFSYAFAEPLLTTKEPPRNS